MDKIFDKEVQIFDKEGVGVSDLVPKVYIGCTQITSWFVPNGYTTCT